MMKCILAILDKGSDIGLWALLFVAPLLLGGRHPLGQALFVGIVSAIAFASVCQAALVRSPWCVQSPLIILALGGVIGVAQLWPIPKEIRSALAPRSCAIIDAQQLALRGHVPSATPSMTTPLSMTPEETQSALCVYVAYAGLFFVLVHRLKDGSHIERYLSWLAVATCTLAVIGLMQFLFGNGKFLWVYAHPTRDTLGLVKGPFANENHFAHCMALGWGPLWWWVFCGRRRPEFRSGRLPENQPRLWCESPRTGAPRIVGVILVGIAALLTYSRGGIMVLLLAALITLAASWWAGIVNRRMITSLLCALIVVVGILLVHGHDRLAQELGTLTSGLWQDIDRGSARYNLWRATLQGVRDFPWLGAGWGSFIEVNPLYLDAPPQIESTHAENGYLQVWLESGTCGFLLLLVGIGFCARWCQRALVGARNTGTKMVAGVITCGLAVSLVHSAFDFVWYLPACMTPAIVLAACAYRLSRVAGAVADRRQVSPTQHVSVFLVAIAIVAVVGWQGTSLMVRRGMAAWHWDAYLRLSHGDVDPFPAWSLSESEFTADKQRQQQRELADVERMIDYLRRCLHWHPAHARAQVRMAGLRLWQFDWEQQRSRNPFPLAQIREAVWASEFSCDEDRRAWLDRVMGTHKSYIQQALIHTTAAIATSPLLGNGYLYLSELDFLRGGDAQASRNWVQCALRVRPYEENVILAAGREAVLRGDLEGSLVYWRHVFRRGTPQQRRILSWMSPYLTAEQLIGVLVPDRDGLWTMYGWYRVHERSNDARHVARILVSEVEASAESSLGSVAAQLWFEAQQLHGYLQDRSSALRCARLAAQSEPSAFSYRLCYAQWLLAAGDLPAAREQLAWCRRHAPEDPRVQQLCSVDRSRGERGPR